MPWITDVELKTAMEGALGSSTGELPSSFPVKIIPWANRMAYQTIRAILIGRGYTDDQLDDWDAREEWNERFGVCLAVKRAAFRGEGYDTQAAIDDCKEAREELAALAILVDGEVVFPVSGRVSYGEFDTSSDRFLLTEPDGEGDWEEGEGTTL